MSVINSKTVKSTLIYFSGSVLSKVMVFLLLPLYTSRIPAVDMGYYDTDTTVITFFASVLFLDIGSTILRYTLASKTENERKSSMSNGLLIFVLSSIVYCLVMSIGRFFTNVDYYGWVVLYGILYAGNNVVGQCIRAIDRSTDYAVAGIIQTAVQVMLNIVLILVFDINYSSLLVSFCLATLISTLYMILRASLWRKADYHLINKEVIIDQFKFTFPLCVNSIAFWFLSSSGRVILRYMNGPEQVGYLSIAGKFTQIMYLVSSCIQLTWQEIAYSHNNADENTGEFYSKAFLMYYKLMIMGVAIAIPLIKIGLSLVPDFIDKSYSESINLIPTSLFGTGLAIVSLFLGTVFSSIKKTSIIFVSTIVGAVTSVISNVLFITVGFGAASVNNSFILGYVATIVVRVFILKKNIDFHLKVMEIVMPLVLFLCVSLLYVEAHLTYSIVAFIVAMSVFIYMFRDEVSMITKQLLRKSRIKH